MKIRWISWIFVFLLIVPCLSLAQVREGGNAYKVAILPFVINSRENLDYLRDGIYDILASRVTVENRIVVIDRSVVERILYEMRPMRLDETVAREIGLKAEADYVVLGSLTKVGDYVSLDARLIHVSGDKPPLTAYTQHKGMDDVMVKIGEFAQDIGEKILGRRVATGRPGTSRPPLAGQGRLSWQERPGEGYSKSQVFPFQIRGLDIGDVDGDKKNELVMMDANNIYVFKYTGEKLTLFQKIEAGYQNNFLTLDVVNVNRVGPAEIVVTSVVEDDLRSLIIEYEEGKFRKVSEASGWFYRVLEHPKDGPILMGQRMGSEGVLQGAIYQMVWKKNSFERGPKMKLPGDTKLFGTAMGRLRDPKDVDFVVLNELDRLNLVTPDGKTIYTSRDHFGGTDIFYDTYAKRDIQYRPSDNISTRVFVQGRILVRDLDKDGLDEVIINKNESSLSIMEKAKSYEKGAIVNLVWAEGSLVQNWSTSQLNGYITDYQIRDVDNDGEEELVVALVTPGGGLAGKPTSTILFFKLS
jgi:TolB-like protein